MRAFNTPEYQNCLILLKINVEFFLLKYFYLGSCCGDQRPVMKTNRKYLIITRQTNCSSAAQTDRQAGPTCNTGGSRGSGLNHAVAAVTLEHDLSPVLDLSHVGPVRTSRYVDINIKTWRYQHQDISPVFVESHIADEQDLAVVYKAGKWTINCK